MKIAEINRRWLAYFEKQDHHIAPSVPLVSPDPSILFTIAGMVPFIPYIVGTQQAPWPRVASVQKCIRTNDIDEVGKTTRHGTFFQMGGNFSFGDYFKEGAITYAFELLTTPQADGGYGLDKDRLWVTLWEEDLESREFLLGDIGLDPTRVQMLPRAETFWDTGQPGPAGPCAEIHYDRGPDYGPEGGPGADTQGDRYLEIWNLVFDQFLRGEGVGKDYPLLRELDHKSIDTGAGIERIAFLLQGVDNFYETDEVFPVIKKTEEMTGKTYGANGEDDTRMRVIADHVRSSLMLIGDGVRPGNDGRGYVLRRLLRRVVRSARLLGVTDPCMPELLSTSRDAMAPSYPEVARDWDRISAVAFSEEESFRRTLEAGTTIFDTAITKAKAEHTVLSGADAFALHDTYGFPIDLTLEMASEKGVDVDEEGFRSLMTEQRERARADARAKKAGHIDTSVYQQLLSQAGGPIPFLGYTDLQAEAQVLAILADGAAHDSVDGPREVEVILSRTPFYAEMGGQLADHGTIALRGGGRLDVHDVQAPIAGLPVHRATLVEGSITVGEMAIASVDFTRRTAIAQAHTATHMVHKALHEFLGEQATQAGSENSPHRLRFDFQHGSQIPLDVLTGIEERVNARLIENLDVTDQITTLDKAKEMGAMALFSEKYGEKVRVVSIGGDWSRELCAGTHMPATGTLGMVSILGESSIGSGVRRIDALVGPGAFETAARERALLSQLSALVGGRPSDLPERISTLLDKLKGAEKTVAQLRTAQLKAKAGSFADAAQTIEAGGKAVRAVIISVEDVANADDARNLALDIRARLGESEAAVVAIFAQPKGRPAVVVATNGPARDLGLQAGALVRVAAKTLGGGGGGRPDVAQGGGQDPAQIPAAIDAVRAEISQG